jgi:hypothetical protein
VFFSARNFDPVYTSERVPERSLELNSSVESAFRVRVRVREPRTRTKRERERRQTDRQTDNRERVQEFKSSRERERKNKRLVHTGGGTKMSQVKQLGLTLLVLLVEAYKSLGTSVRRT